MTLSFSKITRFANGLMGLWLAMVCLSPAVLADQASDKLRETNINILKSRIEEVGYSYDDLALRVAKLDPYDPRKKPPTGEGGKPLYEGADTLLGKAKIAKESLGDLRPEDFVGSDGKFIVTTNTICEKPMIECFDLIEQGAITKINDVNRFLIAPVQPGAEKLGKPGTVPKGDILEEFVPQLIRLMFRFTYFMILISFVVSGVLFIIAFDNTEFTDKAKRMLYYSIIGFAFVTLAFAIVKGITDINFFGFI